MRIIGFILTFFVFLKTVSYGIFEYKQNNKFGSYIIFLLSIISLVLPNIMIFIR